MEFLKWVWRGLFKIGELLASWLWWLFVNAKLVGNGNAAYPDSLNNYDGVPLVIIIESDGKVTVFRSKLNVERANESARKLIMGLSSRATNWECAPVKFSNLKSAAVENENQN